MANTKIEEIEGVGPACGEKLRGIGIDDTDELLEACRTRAGRGDTAEKSGISEALILEGANHADLFRIRDVGPEFAELLEAAGVDSVKALRNRRPRGW